MVLQPEGSAIHDSDTASLIIAIPVVGDVRGAERVAAALKGQPSLNITIALAIIDNGIGAEESRDNREHVEDFAIPTIYIREPRSGIPFARNAAIRAALDRDADALVFIDDDEWPASGWLDALITTWRRTGANIVLGPSKAVLPVGAPRWAITSGVFDKDRRLTDGKRIRTAYSYNTLLDRRTMEELGPTFDPIFRYTGSSDHDYFKRATDAGLQSVWSSGALVYEEVASERLSLHWVLKRGYRIGVGAWVSSQRRLPQHRALTRIMLLIVINSGYATINAVGTWLPNLSWVEALRRSGIVAGLALGSMLRYEEYRESSSTARQPEP